MTNHEDFELKKLLINLMVILSRQPTNLHVRPYYFLFFIAIAFDVDGATPAVHILLLVYNHSQILYIKAPGLTYLWTTYLWLETAIFVSCQYIVSYIFLLVIFVCFSALSNSMWFSSLLQIISDSKVMLALFHYVRANENTTGPQEWSPAQFEELQLHAMSALATLSPILLQDYMSCQGNTRLLILLEWCVSSGLYLSQSKIDKISHFKFKYRCECILHFLQPFSNRE